MCHLVVQFTYMWSREAAFGCQKGGLIANISAKCRALFVKNLRYVNRCGRETMWGLGGWGGGFGVHGDEMKMRWRRRCTGLMDFGTTATT